MKPRIQILLVTFFVSLINLSQNLANPITNEIEKCDLSEELIEEIRSYQPIADRIMKSVLNGQFKDMTYNHLVEFIDKFGNRMSGTENLENSIDYVLEMSEKYGFDQVHGEEVQVPYWIRGKESATMLTPRKQDLRMLGLGSSAGTPPDGITAPIVVVNSFDELKNISSQVPGKIVVYNPPWVSYGETVAYRGKGASEASKYGAVAALVRSITPYSLDNPHTGHQVYEEGVKKIPVACITPADANMLERIHRRGEKITINIKMEAKNAGLKTSRNTVVEIIGRENPEKVVIVSGHLDSWDVGQGAMDDGAGAFLSWSSALLIHKLQLRPRRTIRAIMWTGEEQGVIGAQQYVKEHMDEIQNLNFVMESDIGTFAPIGLAFLGTPEAACIGQEVLNLLKPINTTSLYRTDDGGPDIEQWTNMGVPGAGLWTQNDKYFWYHHSGADTMDIEDPQTLNLCTALWATVSYVIADLSVDIPKKLVLP